GIAIHHLPIAIILTTFFINAGLNKKLILFFMVAFAFMTPLGTLASESLHFLEHYYTEISAVVIGILFHISSTIIFESSENHKFNIAKISVIVLGIVFAYFIYIVTQSFKENSKDLLIQIFAKFFDIVLFKMFQ